MTAYRLLLPLSAALLLGLAACKPSAPADAAGADAAATGTPEASVAGKAAAVVAAVNPFASPRDEVIAAYRKFGEVRSFHAEMVDDDAPGTTTLKIDFIAPDRMRAQMADGSGHYVIGNTMYMVHDGQKMEMPLPAGTLEQWRDPANLKEAEAGLTAESQGTDMLDGVATRKFSVHVTAPIASDSTLWIGPDGLPLQLKSSTTINGKQHGSTLRYSRYNDTGIVIEPPK